MAEADCRYEMVPRAARPLHDQTCTLLNVTELNVRKVPFLSFIRIAVRKLVILWLFIATLNDLNW